MTWFKHRIQPPRIRGSSGGKPAGAIPGYTSWQFHRMFGHDMTIDGCSMCGERAEEESSGRYRLDKDHSVTVYRPSRLWTNEETEPRHGSGRQ